MGVQWPKLPAQRSVADIDARLTSLAAQLRLLTADDGLDREAVLALVDELLEQRATAQRSPR